MEIEEGNKLIAKFVNILYGPSGNKVRYSYLDVKGAHINNGMKFHESWDWIMPVVEKLIKISQKDESSFHQLDNVKDNLLNVDLKGTYEAVVEFIKWYNKQNK